MNRSIKWERLGGAAGIGVVALLLASFLVIPDAPPALDDPIADVRSFFVDNSSNVQVSAYLTGLAGFVFLGFLGSLGSALRDLGRGGFAALVVFPAAALALAMAFVNAAMLDALATRVAAEADQAVIRALYDVQAFVITMGAFALAAFTGSVTAAAWRAGLFPHLVNVLGIVLVPAWLVNGLGVFIESGAFSPTGAVGFAIVIVWLAWVLAVSASLLRRAGAPPVRDAT